MKKILSILLLLTLSFTLAGCADDTGDDLDYSDFDHLSNYSQVLTQEEDQYFVYFYATWCSICATVKTDVLTFTNSNVNDAKVYLIDIDHLAGENFIPGFDGVPTMVTIVNGQLVNMNVGGTAIRITINDTNASNYSYFD
ncbi:MAG: thioredoxin family protein [Candidatus Izemoplasma sp.]